MTETPRSRADDASERRPGLRAAKAPYLPEAGFREGGFREAEPRKKPGARGLPAPSGIPSPAERADGDASFRTAETTGRHPAKNYDGGTESQMEQKARWNRKPGPDSRGGTDNQMEQKARARQPGRNRQPARNRQPGMKDDMHTVYPVRPECRFAPRGTKPPFRGGAGTGQRTRRPKRRERPCGEAVLI